MGLLFPRHIDDEYRPAMRSDTPVNKAMSDDAATDPIDPWLIVVIIVGILIITALAVFMLVHYLRSRRRRSKIVQSAVSMRSPYSQRRYTNLADRHRIEELERNTMIRKSLASRTSLTASPRISQVSSMSDYQLEEPSEEQGETDSLREDWKKWEARIQSERKSAGPRDIGLDQHPALTSQLSIPQPTRMASPIRGVISSQADTPPPRLVVTQS
ncbi:hypothetical protein F5Y19DRAFT_370723 [Xylariaceae sp. FL1651]|nr:hypothetical protein F5Y19DRAFT_370723 [Xylariaceae sp. FL1651]